MLEANDAVAVGRLQRLKWLLYQYGADAGLAVPQLAIRRTADGHQKFFDTRQFDWVREVEAAHSDIAAEYARLSPATLPAYQEVERVNLELNQDDQWKTYFVHFYGHRLPHAERMCPRTVEVLRQIPGLQFAMFSVLGPHKHVRAHRGPYNGVLRYHLGVQVPEGCEIRVDDQVRAWKSGESLVFDDSFEHEVWNRSAAPRCVLFADVERPLPSPLREVNAWILRRSAASALSKDTLENIRAWERAHA